MKHRSPKGIDMNKPQRGSDHPCRTCGIATANQHTLGESAKCDGIRNGFLDKQGRPLPRKAVA